MTMTTLRQERAEKIDRALTVVCKFAAALFIGWLLHAYLDKSADQAKKVLPAVINQIECEKREALANEVVSPKQLDHDCKPVKVDPTIVKQ